MELNQALLFSNSILYKKIVKIALGEIAPSATVFTESDIDNVLPFLRQKACEFFILDTASVMEYNSLLESIVSKFSKLQIVLLCSSKEAEQPLFSKHVKHRVHVIVKNLDEGYDSNFRTVKRGLQLALLQQKPETQELYTWGRIPIREPEEKKYSLLLIASSTGGPNALTKILTKLPNDIGVPVLVVQHMPPGFTKNLAYNLEQQSMLYVSEGASEQPIKENHVYIAPGGYHMTVDKRKRLAIEYGDLVNGVRPSADVLFASVAEVYSGKKILAVILTGMGSDGTEGVRLLKKIVLVIVWGKMKKVVPFLGCHVLFMRRGCVKSWCILMKCQTIF